MSLLSHNERGSVLVAVFVSQVKAKKKSSLGTL